MSRVLSGGNGGNPTENTMRKLLYHQHDHKDHIQQMFVSEPNKIFSSEPEFEGKDTTHFNSKAISRRASICLNPNMENGISRTCLDICQHCCGHLPLVSPVLGSSTESVRICQRKSASSLLHPSLQPQAGN